MPQWSELRCVVLVSLLASSIRILPAEDCNENGIDDSIDIASTSLDCNENGRPDECEIGKFFGPFLEQATARDPQGLQAVDFDGDGDTDLALCAFHRVWLYPNTGSGILGEPLELVIGNHPATEADPRDLVFSDHDLDGDLDLAIVCALPSNAFVLIQKDSTSYSPPLVTRMVPGSFVAAGDLDSDGDDDLVLTSSGLLRLRNAGQGSFDPLPVLAVPAQSRAAIADLNGDGRNDLAFGGSTIDGVGMLENTGVGFGPLLSYDTPDYPVHVLAADLNGDRHIDIVSWSRQGRRLTVAWNAGDGSFVRMLNFEFDADVQAAALSDLDVDGDLDLLTMDALRQLSAFRHAGPETFTPLETLRLPGQLYIEMLAADLDGDGDPDPVVPAVEDDRWFLVPNLAGKFSTYDCNANGILDGCELSSGSARDCDLDSVPDECQVAGNDCNSNLVPDACDLTSETSRDCNGNGLPDECDLAGQPTLDCNDNDVPDVCEFSPLDCDEDGTPDDCQIAVDPSLDCDLDGLLDRCGWDPVFKLETPQSLHMGNYSQDLRIADLSGDGFPDLVAGNDGTRVSVAIGLGVSRYRIAEVQAGIAPRRVAVADWDGDAILDIAAANFASNNISVHNGTGNGLFAPAKFYRVAPAPSDLLGQDVDADGDLDIVALSAPVPFDPLGPGGALSVMLNDGEGRYAGAGQATVPPCGPYLAGGDLDGDGDPDAVITGGAYEGAAMSFSFIASRGDGTFESARLVETPGITLALHPADLDGNGDLELGASLAPDGIILFDHEPGRGFLTTGSVDGITATSLEFADIDGDGRQDLVGADLDEYVVHTLKQGGDGSYGAPHRHFLHSPFQIRLGDLDTDGDLDLACAHGSPPAPGEYVSWMRNRGDGEFGADALSVGREPAHILAVDLDGDRYTDVVTANGSEASITVLYGDGFGGFPAKRHVPCGGGQTISAAGDLDGNGSMDIAVARRDRVVSVLMQESHREFGDPRDLPLQGQPLALALSDATFDGIIDLIVVCANPGFEKAGICFFRGLESGGLESSPAITSLENRIWSAAISDLDGDGRLDVVGAGNYRFDDYAELIVSMGSEAGSFLPPVTSFFLGARATFAPGDLEGDGTEEIAVVYDDVETSVILEHQGGGRYAPGKRPELGFHGHGVEIVDVDGDEFPDILVGGRDQQLLIAFNEGGTRIRDPIGVRSRATGADFTAAALRPGAYPALLTLEGSHLVVQRPTTAPLRGKDCNGNGVLDACEVEGHDVNANDVPDDCDITRGLLRDDDRDGEPDGSVTLSRFHRADTNADGRLNITDPVALLVYLFDAGEPPACMDAADSNDDGAIDLADAVHSLRFMFLGSAAPPPPGPPPRPCAADPDPATALGCDMYAPCR